MKDEDLEAATTHELRTALRILQSLYDAEVHRWQRYEGQLLRLQKLFDREAAHAAETLKR